MTTKPDKKDGTEMPGPNLNDPKVRQEIIDKQFYEYASANGSASYFMNNDGRFFYRSTSYSLSDDERVSDIEITEDEFRKALNICIAERVRDLARAVKTGNLRELEQLENACGIKNGIAARIRELLGLNK
jgi:hypothetical protein